MARIRLQRGALRAHRDCPTGFAARTRKISHCHHHRSILDRVLCLSFDAAHTPVFSTQLAFGMEHAAAIKLPSEQHKVYYWKVRPGASVRLGETIAFAVPKDTPQASVADVQAPVNKQKRPSKRKRPGAAVAATDSTAATNGSNAAAVATSSAEPSAASDTVEQVPILSPAEGILTVGSRKGDSAVVVGYVEPCQHPTVVQGLCAVCGASIQPKDDPEQENKDDDMSRMTVSGLTVTVSASEGKRIAEQDAERLRKIRKLSLVLDLDHTLVHATHDLRAMQHVHRNDVREIGLPNGGGPPHRHFLKLRPHLEDFLHMALDKYEVGIYTAGTRDYAEEVALTLARQVAGARYDSQMLAELHWRIGKCEYELAELEKKAQEKPEDGKEEPTSGKRVRFGELPETEKSDHATKNQLDSLRRELAEAEEAEKRAQDVRNRLFGSRVVSRTDVADLGMNVKSLKRIFPCGGTMAVVVDDREDVWANAADVPVTRKGEPPDNMLLVKPYHWDPFAGFADVNNASGVDITAGAASKDAVNTDGDAESDTQLQWITNILKRIHGRYYTGRDGSDEHTNGWSTVPEIVKTMRSEVLQGTNIVLSGLIPLHRQQSGDPDAPRPNVLRYAESLGAVVSTSVTPATTHVVAARDRSEKTLAARRIPGCAVVSSAWLMDCYWSISRKNALLYLLGDPPLLRSRNEAVAAPSNEEDSDDDDDDLAAMLEEELTEE